MFRTVSYLVVNPDSILQEPVLLLLHPVRLKRLLTDFTWLQEGKYEASLVVVYYQFLSHFLNLNDTSHFVSAQRWKLSLTVSCLIIPVFIYNTFYKTYCSSWRSRFRSHLSHLVLGGSNALELLLLGGCLALLNLLLVLLFKELTLGSLLQVSDLLKLDPVLTGAQTGLNIWISCF